jgi:hypothetical protein
MKLHTNLTGPDVGNTLLRAQRKGHVTSDVEMTVFTLSPSQTHPNGFEIQLGAWDRDSLPRGYVDQHGKTMRVRRFRNSDRSEARYAASWHEWGWFIAEIFAADPGARWSWYASPADFHRKTGNQFKTWTPPVTHRDGILGISVPPAQP